MAGFLSTLPGLLLGSFCLRPYVFGFLLLYLLVAAAEWGWPRASTFTLLAGALAFVAEWSSTRTGVPFGMYHYTGVTRGQELYLGNVPFFDSLSFTFLAYASLGTARQLLGRLAPGGVLALTTGVLMMWLDLVIDPLAVRGDRWFLGRIFYYPSPGLYFGVPIANFLGWAVLGTAIAGLWLAVSPGLRDAPPAWRARLPGRVYQPLLLYYLVLGFNLALTGWVAEPALFWTGLALHLPLAALVVSSSTTASACAPEPSPDGVVRVRRGSGAGRGKEEAKWPSPSPRCGPLRRTSSRSASEGGRAIRSSSCWSPCSAATWPVRDAVRSSTPPRSSRST